MSDLDIIETIRLMRLSYFELTDPAIRARVIDMLAEQRRHGYPSHANIEGALDHLVAACDPNR